MASQTVKGGEVRKVKKRRHFPKNSKNSKRVAVNSEKTSAFPKKRKKRKDILHYGTTGRGRRGRFEEGGPVV